MEKGITYIRKRYISHIKDSEDPLDFGYMYKAHIYDEPELCEKTLLDQSKLASISMMDGTRMNMSNTLIPVLFYIEKNEKTSFKLPSHYMRNTNEMLNEFFKEFQKNLHDELIKILKIGFNMLEIRNHDQKIDSILLSIINSYSTTRLKYPTLIMSKFVSNMDVFKKTLKIFDAISMYIKAYLCLYIEKYQNATMDIDSTINTILTSVFKDIINGNVPKTTELNKATPFLEDNVINFIADETSITGSSGKYISSPITKLDTSFIGILKSIDKEFVSTIEIFFSSYDPKNCYNVIIYLSRPTTKFVGATKKSYVNETDEKIEFDTIAPKIQKVTFIKQKNELFFGKGLIEKVFFIDERKNNNRIIFYKFF